MKPSEAQRPEIPVSQIETRNPASFQPARLGWRILTRFASDRKRARKLGVKLILEPAAMYYMILELVGIPPDEASAAGFDRLFWLWSQHILAGDAVLDEHGYRLPLDLVEGFLAKLDRDGVLRIAFGPDGPSEQELCTLRCPLMFYNDPRNRLEVFNNFPDSVDRFLEERMADRAGRARVRAAVSQASRNLYLAYVMERRCGLRPSFEEMWELLSAKTDASPLLDAAALLTAHPVDSQSLASARWFLSNGVLCLQILDEIKDVDEDYNHQPNLVMALSRERYPEEARRIERRLDTGRHISGWSGLLLLWLLAPRTLFRTLGLFYRQLRKLGSVHPWSEVPCMFVVHRVCAVSQAPFGRRTRRRRL